MANRAWPNRPLGAVVVALALLNVFTLGAGAAVAALMPAQLDRWDVARVADRPLSPPGQVLAGPAATAPLPTRSGLAAALRSVMSSATLGKQVGVVVTDPASGRVLYASGAASMLPPASTAKLATAVAALDVLGPHARFRTRVAAGATPGSIVLVGGGDPTLTAGPPPASDYPQPATLKALAAATARALRARGRDSVRLGYDTALFTGPQLAPGWPEAYVTTGNVTGITALEVDQGRLTRSGAPQDADDPKNFRPRSTDPAGQAAAAFRGFLAADGIRVLGQLRQQTAPRHAGTVAAVSSPPLSAIVGAMLRESNNVIAEDLARQVALHRGHPASFSGAAAAVTGVLGSLGVRRGIHLVDGSGLSPQDRIAPNVLARLVGLAASRSHPQLRAVITGLPVAGFLGTLAPGGSVFGKLGGAGLGVVRAKTGNLSTVATLAGLVYDSSGRVLAFAFMSNGVPDTQAAKGIDAMAAALARCGCR